VQRPSTLVEALALLPRGEDRGFRFRSVRGEEQYDAFPAIEAEAHRRAALLAGLGLQKGDRVALVLADPREFVMTFLGAVVAGAVPVPIYPRASFKAKNSYVDTVAHIVRASGARVLITLEETKPVVAEITAHETPLERVVVLEDPTTAGPSGSSSSSTSGAWRTRPRCP